MQTLRSEVGEVIKKNFRAHRKISHFISFQSDGEHVALRCHQRKTPDARQHNQTVTDVEK